jgi:hypothetical protein
VILSRPDDAHVPLVTRKLDERRVPYLRFDPASFPQDAFITITLGDSGVASRWLHTADAKVDLSLVTVVWNRRAAFSTPDVKLAQHTVANYVELARRHLLDGLWGGLDPLRRTPMMRGAPSGKVSTWSHSTRRADSPTCGTDVRKYDATRVAARLPCYATVRRASEVLDLAPGPCAT